MASAKTRGVPAAPRQMDESFLSSRKIPSTQLYRDESIHPCDQVNERNGFTLKRVPIAGSGRWNPKVTDAVKHLKANIKTYLNYYGAEFGDAGTREIAAPLRYNTPTTQSTDGCSTREGYLCRRRLLVLLHFLPVATVVAVVTAVVSCRCC